jgi:cobalamin synthase
MSTSMSKWLVPAVGFVLGLLFAAALMGRQASPVQAVIAFAIVAGYALALRGL